MRIANRESVPGGWRITLEFPNAYTDGTSRFEQVFLSCNAVEGKSREEIQQAVREAYQGADLEGLLGETVPEVISQTKALLVARMVRLYERWLMWKTTRQEAQARGMSAPIITALTNAENSAWAVYGAAINKWRLAP